MSFRCEDCKSAFPNKDLPDEYSPHRVVTKTLKFDDRPGSQIVEERNLCRVCAVNREKAA